jgi:hypothetical protein
MSGPVGILVIVAIIVLTVICIALLWRGMAALSKRGRDPELGQRAHQGSGHVGRVSDQPQRK